MTKKTLRLSTVTGHFVYTKAVTNIITCAFNQYLLNCMTISTSLSVFFQLAMHHIHPVTNQS